MARNRYKLKGIVFLLVVIVILIGSIALYPMIKGEYYRLKVIKAIEDTTVKGTTDIMDGLDIYINKEESKKIIVDTLIKDLR